MHACDLAKDFKAAMPAGCTRCVWGRGSSTAATAFCNVWNGSYKILLPPLRAAAELSEHETWLDTVDQLKANHIAAIEAVANSRIKQLRGSRAGKEVSHEAVQVLANEDRLHPSPLDVFLRWIIKLSGARFGDANGIQWPRVEHQKHPVAQAVVASSDSNISQKLRAKRADKLEIKLWRVF